MDSKGAFVWTGQPVDVGLIEEELVRLRYGAAGSPPGGEGYAIRTSLLNLVVYASNAAVADEASKIIDGLTRDHPSRALIIVASPSEDESRIEAKCSAHCHVATGLEQQVCCEEVMLNVSGRAAGHLHSIIIPLLVPDLPVYVWWTGPLPRDRHLFEEMVEAADRIIVDSGHFRHPTHGLRRVADLCGAIPDCVVGDLNWARLGPWRELLLSYGGEPGLRAYREAVSAVEITYAGDETTAIPSDAFLLVGWLAERLGWETGSPDAEARRVRLRRGVSQLSVTFLAREPEYSGPRLPETGALLRVRLEDEQGAALTIKRSDDPVYLEVEVRTPDYIHQQRVRFGLPTASEMLAAELDDVPGQTSEFEQSLRRALPVIQAFDVAH